MEKRRRQTENLLVNLIPLKEYQEKHDVSERTVYRWINDDEVQTEKVRGKLYIKEKLSPIERAELVEKFHDSWYAEWVIAKMAEEDPDFWAKKVDWILFELSMYIYRRLKDDIEPTEELKDIISLFLQVVSGDGEGESKDISSALEELEQSVSVRRYQRRVSTESKDTSGESVPGDLNREHFLDNKQEERQAITEAEQSAS